MKNSIWCWYCWFDVGLQVGEYRVHRPYVANHVPGARSAVSHSPPQPADPDWDDKQDCSERCLFPGHHRRPQNLPTPVKLVQTGLFSVFLACFWFFVCVHILMHVCVCFQGLCVKPRFGLKHQQSAFSKCDRRPPGYEIYLHHSDLFFQQNYVWGFSMIHSLMGFF